MKLFQHVMKYIYIVIFAGATLVHFNAVHSFKVLLFGVLVFSKRLRVVFGFLAHFLTFCWILLMQRDSLPFTSKHHRNPLRKHQSAQIIHHRTRSHHSCFAERNKIWGLELLQFQSNTTYCFTLMWAFMNSYDKKKKSANIYKALVFFFSFFLGFFLWCCISSFPQPFPALL